MMAAPVWGNETDQFLLPTDVEMVDVGRLISAAHCRVLEDVTEGLNRRIAAAQRIADPARRGAALERLHDPGLLADKVRAAFGPGFFETIGMENSLRSRPAKRACGGDGEDATLIYKRMDWIYAFAHLPFDPRNIPMALPSSTVRVYGSYVGTDKFGHFHDLGHIYFKDYLGKRRAGKDERQATEEVVWMWSRGPIAETTAIGFLATGVCSNADLAANYMGLKFYRNLTEPMVVQGEERPPMLVVVGGYWQLNHHVRPDSDFFAPFVSDHWNEALNPCVYEWGLRWTVERRMRNRAEEILAFYCDVDGRPRDAAYFADLAVELSTYDGEDYGYFTDPREIMGIATACFESADADATDAEAPDDPGTVASTATAGMGNRGPEHR